MKLLKKIEEEGEKEEGKILAEAQVEAERRLAEAEGQIATWRENYRKQAQQKIEGEKRLIISRARAQARGVLLRAKSRAAETIFEKLFQEAGALRADPTRYKTFLERCLREAEREISGALVLLIDPSDETLVRALLSGTQHKIGDKIKTSGGFIATNPKGDFVVDNRLETRIANIRQRYRPELGKALFDQATAPKAH
jgi:vacuolar-type H+-ATPase subunit E/Vma4